MFITIFKMRKRKKNSFRNYYVVPYIFNDEGKKQKRLLRVPRGCKFLYNARINIFPGEKEPRYYKGHKVMDWIYVYSADDAEADEYAPIIELKKEDFSLRLFERIVRFLGF